MFFILYKFCPLAISFLLAIITLYYAFLPRNIGTGTIVVDIIQRIVYATFKRIYVMGILYTRLSIFIILCVGLTVGRDTVIWIIFSNYGKC